MLLKKKSVNFTIIIWLFLSYSLITNSPSEMSDQKALIVPQTAMSLQFRAPRQRQTELIRPRFVHLGREVRIRRFRQLRLLVQDGKYPVRLRLDNIWEEKQSLKKKQFSGCFTHQCSLGCRWTRSQEHLGLLSCRVLARISEFARWRTVEASRCSNWCRTARNC